MRLCGTASRFHKGPERGFFRIVPSPVSCGIGLGEAPATVDPKRHNRSTAPHPKAHARLVVPNA